MSEASIAACSCVLLKNVVVRVLPFNCTVDPETNALPLTLSVNEAPPDIAPEGESDVSDGTGFPDAKVARPIRLGFSCTTMRHRVRRQCLQGHRKTGGGSQYGCRRGYAPKLILAIVNEPQRAVWPRSDARP